jgi:hypothetical protein
MLLAPPQPVRVCCRHSLSCEGWVKPRGLLAIDAPRPGQHLASHDSDFDRTPAITGYGPV